MVLKVLVLLVLITLEVFFYLSIAVTLGNSLF